MWTDVLLSGSNGKTVRGLVGYIYGVYIFFGFCTAQMVSFLFVRSVWETEVVSLGGGWV